MSYDDRLNIKQSFKKNGKEYVNSFKMIEFDDYIQVYVKNGDKYGHCRLDRDAVKEVIKYLEKALDSLK